MSACETHTDLRTTAIHFTAQTPSKSSTDGAVVIFFELDRVGMEAARPWFLFSTIQLYYYRFQPKPEDPRSGDNT